MRLWFRKTKQHPPSPSPSQETRNSSESLPQASPQDIDLEEYDPIKLAVKLRQLFDRDSYEVQVSALFRTPDIVSARSPADIQPNRFDTATTASSPRELSPMCATLNSAAN